MKNWNQVKLVPEFNEQGVACYKLAGGNYVNEYYVVSEAETRKLLNTPEIVGYEVYDCLIPSTSQMLYYFKEQKKVTTANILSILRGALNYPWRKAATESTSVYTISVSYPVNVYLRMKRLQGLKSNIVSLPWFRTAH